MKISDQLKKEHRSLNDRGIPDGSHFEVVFEDGSTAHEIDTNWSDFCEEQLVYFEDRQKVVRVSKHKISSITVSHENLQTVMTFGPSEDVYQAITSIAMSDGSNKIIGRKVGKIRNGVVIEERFIDGRTGEITGLKF